MCAFVVNYFAIKFSPSDKLWLKIKLDSSPPALDTGDRSPLTRHTHCLHFWLRQELKKSQSLFVCPFVPKALNLDLSYSGLPHLSLTSLKALSWVLLGLLRRTDGA